VLRPALRDSNEHVRRSAVLAVALLGRRETRHWFELAASNLREGDPGVRRIALLALGRFPDKDVTTILLDTLVQPSTSGSVKLMAAFLLKDRKDADALKRLKKAARARTEQDLRSALLLALSNFEDPETVDIITLTGLADTRDQVKAAAAIACTRFERPEHRALCAERLTILLKQGALDSELRADLELARRILLTGDPSRAFNFLGNQSFAGDLGKDVEEKLLDLVNEEAERVLGVASLTPIIATGRREFRAGDETSDLRDLEAYLDRHPYFEPEDVPVPKLAITPRVPDPGKASDGPAAGPGAAVKKGGD
jgi:hypothetical protein